MGDHPALEALARAGFVASGLLHIVLGYTAARVRAAIARAYGTHSLRRARHLLTYIEEQGLIVCQLDGAGRRIVTLVELAWATAAADPNAATISQKR